jgi:hypothetical protein
MAPQQLPRRHAASASPVDTIQVPAMTAKARPSLVIHFNMIAPLLVDNFPYGKEYLYVPFFAIGKGRFGHPVGEGRFVSPV